MEGLECRHANDRHPTPGGPIRNLPDQHGKPPYPTVLRWRTLISMLKLDYANCLSDRVGPHGLDPTLLDAKGSLATQSAQLTRAMEQTRGTGWERWRGLPFEPMRSAHVDAIQAIVERYRGRIDNLVVLGIGGSALGNIALQSALNPPTHNLQPASQRGEGGGAPRVFVVDNVDPNYLFSVLNFVLDDDPTLDRTLFNVVSKSGETAETASQFMTIRSLLIERRGKDRHAEQIVAITDPKAGTMRRICDDNGYATLPVPDGVGGRFSVLSPVGLFSAAMAGIDIDGLLDGAARMDQRCSAENMLENPAALLATLLVELGEGRGVESPKPNHVLMPYANQLYLLADWFRQLWAESLGKRHDLSGKDGRYAGFTPIKALGTTDQHSQVQLYREGPNDKVVGFLEVEQFGDPAHTSWGGDFNIPTGLGVEALVYLEGRSFAELLNAEKRATEYALIESQRPNFTLKFEGSPAGLKADEIGEFISLWQITTAYAGLMLNIDAYDQPAVETGKLATFGLMGREGYAEWKSKVDAKLAKSNRVV
jgi:glucose-6-phosphate isomerase